MGGMHMNLWGIIPVLVIMVLYTGWAFIYHAMSSEWVYSFLDYTKPAAAYMYPGVLFASVIFFFGAYGVHKLRDRMFRSRALLVPAKSAALQPVV
ncbi:hypothetical protein BCR44DRAFT_1437655 [Catenaria anguillulae PL171]|uniref:Uncharacterized protein n=1 Tax=Catenaria anguillulae PL171 TaxID=765915 RepID=A0A1Y2HGU6_9FUNG|nr:hypothetical protein BCR44DRAFT_1437655 [Catenaria anguillulae PL171]